MDGRLSGITRQQGCVIAAILMAFVMATAQPIGAAEKVGGPVYENILVPLGTGVPGVQVYVDGPAGHFETTTSDEVSPLLDGLWEIDAVPVGTYTVRLYKSGYRFEHVVIEGGAGVSDGQDSTTIVIPESATAQQKSALQSIQFLAIATDPLDPAQSTVEATPPAVYADGTSEVTVTITVVDTSGSPMAGIPAAEIQVSVSPAGPVVTQPTAATDASGQTTATLTSTAWNTFTVSVNVDDTTITDTADVEFMEPPHLTFTLVPTPTVAAGETFSVEVTAQDASGGTDTAFNQAVTIALNPNPGGGTLSGANPQTAVNGVATFSLSIDKAGAGYALEATAPGIMGAQSSAFDIVPGPFDADNSVVAVSPTSLVVSNSVTSTITVMVRDAYNNPIPGIDGATIALSATPIEGLSIDPVAATDTDANGQTTATIKSTKAEIKTITVTVGGTPITGTAQVTFTPGPVNAGQSMVNISPSSVATGEDSIVTITAQDEFGNPIPGILPGEIVVTATGTGNEITGPTAATNTSGIATATISSTAVGTKTVSVTVSSVSVGPALELTVVPGPVSAANSLVEATPETVIADGVEVSTITITAKDAYGNPIPDIEAAAVAVLATGTDNTIVQPTAATDASGQTTATIASTQVETKTVSATIDTTLITDTAEVEFTGDPILNISKSDSDDPVDANDVVTYTITYSNTGIADANNTVIVETLPAELLDPTSISNEGVYDAEAGTITWDLGTLDARGTDQTVSFAARVDPNMVEGGLITNSSLTIDCDNDDVGPKSPNTAETTTVNDSQGPVITLLTPQAGATMVAVDTIVRVQITDGTGVDYAGDTVTIEINDDLIYDGANETVSTDPDDPNLVYDSRGLNQQIEGRCRRTGSATDYTFTFLPSGAYGFDRRLIISVHATDTSGNATNESFSLETHTRVFAANARVNAADTLNQDNPATATDSQGTIWVAWDQPGAAGGNTDIRIASLVADGEAFEESAAPEPTANDERNPAIAVGPADTLYAVWENDAPNSWDVLFASYDGTTWSTPVSIAQESPTSPTDQTAPSIAVDDTGVIHVVWEDSAGTNGSIWLASSSDGGATWSQDEITDQDAVNPTQPLVAVDDDGYVYVVWTDSRNAATSGTDIYGTSSDEDPPLEENHALVNAAGDQSTAAGAVAADVHLLWISDGNDVMYANDANDLPLTGTSIIDPNEPGDRATPTLAVLSVYGADALFGAWEDGRYASSGDVGDIFFAEGGSALWSNVLVNDDTGTARQMKPAIGIGGQGPYVVWADRRNGNYDIFYAGAVAVRSAAQPTVTTDPNSGVSTVSTGDPNLPEVVIPPNALPPGVVPGDITIRRASSLPEPPANGIGVGFEFGPSGTQFVEPVTLRIPLVNDAGYASYRVYRYDPALGWTENGILNNPVTPAGTAGSRYLEVRVSHFSLFTAAGVTSTGDYHGGSGGCALTPWSNSSPTEFAVPFVIYAFVLLMVTMIDRLRRRSSSARR